MKYLITHLCFWNFESTHPRSIRPTLEREEMSAVSWAHMMEDQNKTPNEAQQYASTLGEVMEVFESCGCSAEVIAAASSEATLTIKGPVSFCPTHIFEEHVEKAKELMQASHPDVAFRVEVSETE